jgi:hypothetical protein
LQSSSRRSLQKLCRDISLAHVVVACVSKDYAAHAMSTSRAEYNFVMAQGRPLALARLSADVDFSHIDFVSCRDRDSVLRKSPLT